MRDEYRTPLRTGSSITAAIAERYQVPLSVARLSVSRGVHHKCAEIADRNPDRSGAFICALDVLTRRPRVRVPRLPPLAELLARCEPEGTKP